MKNIISEIKKWFNKGSVESRAANAVLFGLVGSASSRFFIFVVNIIISNILGREAYGAYSLVNSTIQTFVVFASMGLGASMVRYTSAYRDKDKKTCGQLIGTLVIICLVLSVCVSALVALCAPFISEWVSKTHDIESYFKMASVIILFISLTSIGQNILLGLEKNKCIAKNEIVYGCVCLIAIPIFTYFWGIIGALLGMAFARFVNCVLMGSSALKQSKKEGIKWSVKFDKLIKQVIVKFTIPSFMASVFVVPLTWVLNSLLVKHSGFADMAVYSVAVQWITIITYIMQLFTKAKPVYVQLYEDYRIGELKKLLKKMVLISTCIGIPIAVFGCLGSKFIMGLYGESYIDGYMTFSIMMLASIAVVLQSQFGAIFEATGKMWTGFILNIIWAFNLSFMFVCLIDMGAFGYSIAYLVSYILHCIYSYIAVYIILRKRKELIHE